MVRRVIDTCYQSWPASTARHLETIATGRSGQSVGTRSFSAPHGDQGQNTQEGKEGSLSRCVRSLGCSVQTEGDRE